MAALEAEHFLSMHALEAEAAGEAAAPPAHAEKVAWAEKVAGAVANGPAERHSVEAHPVGAGAAAAGDAADEDDEHMEIEPAEVREHEGGAVLARHKVHVCAFGNRAVCASVISAHASWLAGHGRVPARDLVASVRSCSFASTCCRTLHLVCRWGRWYNPS